MRRGCGCLKVINEPFEFKITNSNNIKVYTDNYLLPNTNEEDWDRLNDKIVCDFTYIIKLLECGILPDIEILLEEISLIYMRNCNYQGPVKKMYSSELLFKEESNNNEIDVNQISNLIENHLVEIRRQLNKKLDKLIAGENIKTINGKNLIGAGNIDTYLYDSTFEDSIATNANLGNILSGTDISELEGKSISELLDKMLFKEEWPEEITSLAEIFDNISVPSLVEEGTLFINISLPSITYPENSIVEDDIPNSSSVEIINSEDIIVDNPNTYNISGDWKYNIHYSYPEIIYNITSSFGNSREVVIPSVTDGIKTYITKVTRAVYINNEKLQLFPLQTQKIITKILGGNPEIRVPWSTSFLKVEVDLGFGFMEVDGWTRTIEDEYIVMRKNDSYSSLVPHRFTITLNKS